MDRFSSPDELIDRIREEVRTQHAYLNHPLIHALLRGELSRDDLRMFIHQFWALPRFNYAINAGKLSQVQPVPGQPFGQGEPYDINVRRHFVSVVVDEVGKEALAASPTAGHDSLWLQLSDKLGIPREDMFNAETYLPTTLLVMYAWVDFGRNAPLIESSIGQNFVNESAFSEICPRIARALQDHYGLTADDVAFFTVHGEEDVEHSGIGPYMIRTYATTPEVQERVWLAARRGLGFAQALFSGIWEALPSRKTAIESVAT